MTVSLLVLTIGVIVGVRYGGLGGPTGCADMADPHERDLCWYDQLTAQPTDNPDVAFATLQQISDPIVRSAGVVGWMDAHPKADLTVAARLCTLLTGTEKMACERRMSSPHLHR